jgi:hypothetical protein
VIEAWTIRPGQVIDVPTQGPLLVMDIEHLPRYGKVEVTFDTGFTTRIGAQTLVRPL